MRNILIIFSLLLVFVGCTERIELDLNDGDNQRLVVDAWITDQEGPQSIDLTLTTSYFQNEAAPKATGANVKITYDNEEILFTEVSNGIYESPADFKGEVGTTYSLNIDYQGETYESQATMNRIIEMDSVSYQYDDEEEGFYEFIIYTQEPEGEGDHYLFKSYVNGSLIADTLRNVEFTSDFLVDGSYIGGVDVGYEEFKAGDEATLEVWSISEEAHDFFLAVMIQTDWRGGPFDTPPANIPTNISNGALGFFNASATTQNSLTIGE